jgi:colanic acid biosynthesis glycosyl transferase WcaI
VRVLFVNIYWHPDPTGTGKLLHELACDLADRGHEVAVVTSVPHYGSSPAPERERRRLVHAERLGGVELRRTAVWVPRRVTLASRVVNYLSFAMLVVPAGFRLPRPDVIVATWPLLAGLPAWLLARMRGARFVLNVQDVVPAGLLGNPIAAVGHALVERLLLKLADRLVVLSEPMARLLEQRGAAAGKLRAVPNWIDLDEIRPRPRDEAVRERLGVSADDLLVLSSGNVGQLGGLDCVLEAFALLRDAPRLKLRVVGHGNARDRLERRARELGLAQVEFRDTVPRDRFPSLLAAADLCLVARDGRFAGHNVPSRAQAFQAAARPILAVLHPDNEVSRVVLREECGLWAPQDEPETLAALLRSALEMPRAELERLGRNGRRHVEREHGREPLTARWEAVLAEA